MCIKVKLIGGSSSFYFKRLSLADNEHGSDPEMINAVRLDFQFKALGGQIIYGLLMVVPRRALANVILRFMQRSARSDSSVAPRICLKTPIPHLLT